MVSCNPNLLCDKTDWSVFWNRQKNSKATQLLKTVEEAKNCSRPVFFLMKKQCYIVFQNSKAYFARYVQFNTILSSIQKHIGTVVKA